MNGVVKSLDGMPVVVLGAGRGRRMGGPKSLMMIEGRAWWMWQDERLRGYGLVPHWVVSELVRDEMGASGCAPEQMVIADESAPMFGSVLVGVGSVADLERGAFLLPVDTPAPEVEHWERISCSDVPAHPTFHDKGGHPLYLPCDWIERELGALVTAAKASGSAMLESDVRLDRLIEGASHRMAVDDPGVVVNMNEPADVTEWLLMRDED